MSLDSTILFIKAAISGFAIAAPIGSLGLMTIRRTIKYGFLAGVNSGLGVAAADSLYAAVAVFGLTFISDFLLHERKIMLIAGGLFLLVIAWRVYFNKDQITESEKTQEKYSAAGIFFPTFFLTAMHPITIISFTAVFAGLGITSDYSIGQSLMVVAGVFTGSMLWWLSLSAIIISIRTEVILKNIIWVNRITGLLLLGFGIWALLAAFFWASTDLSK